MFKLLIFSTTLFLCACAGLVEQDLVSESSTTNSDAINLCRQFYFDLDDAVRNAEVEDAQTTRIKGFPYLHTNRFLSSLRTELHDSEKFQFWLKQLSLLAQQTLAIEHRNLPIEKRQTLNIQTLKGHTPDITSTLNSCGELLSQHDFMSADNRQRLINTAVVADDYHTWKRIVGLYALTAIPFSWGIDRWHQESTAALTQPLQTRTAQGPLIQYLLTDAPAFSDFAQVRAAVNLAKQNSLAIPLPEPEVLNKLFATYAPIWEVETVSNDDRIGTPLWGAEANIAHIDTSTPTVYKQVSYTRFNQQILLQLNYIVWFPARTCTSSVDLLCGHIDGLIWRVTLNNDGQPLVYDSIHNCGCYHTFFPSNRLELSKSSNTYEEAAFAPMVAPTVDFDSRIIVRIASGSHYIEAVYAGKATSNSASVLQWEDYHRLRSLVMDNNSRRSLFLSNGIVNGTQRGERWFFWPMGITSAGAMRQWGKHATAFVGRRHFDDPYLMERAFHLKEEPQQDN